jgi:threonine dehydratase
MRFRSEDLDWAAGIVGRWVPPTPQYVWPLLAEYAGAEVWVKHENHTPTGAFKVRGGLVYAERLRAGRPEVKGIVSATRGNHGQSLAFAGRAAGIGVTIVVPEGNSPDKNAAMRGFGAELIVHGRDYQSSREHASELGAQRGLETVPPFHPDLVLGVATYARELFGAAGELDTVYVPVGMGSGICGIIGVRDLLGLRTEVVGVAAAAAPATALSFEAGRVVTTDTSHTFVDGVATRVPDADAVAMINAGAARVLTISEDDAAQAMRVLFSTTHNVPEPAGALALAGLLAERPQATGKRVGVIQTGGNADTGLLLQVLAGQTPTV